MEQESSKTNSAESKLNWTSRMKVELIEKYKNHICLWDRKCPLYRDKKLRDEALEDLAVHFDTSINEVKRKIHNLRNQFNQEYQKVLKHNREGAEDECKWIYYDMLKFIVLGRNPRSSYEEHASLLENSFEFNTTTSNSESNIELIETEEEEILDGEEYEVIVKDEQKFKPHSKQLEFKVIQEVQQQAQHEHPPSKKQPVKMRISNLEVVPLKQSQISYYSESIPPAKKSRLITLDNSSAPKQPAQHYNQQQHHSNQNSIVIETFDQSQQESPRMSPTGKEANDEFSIFGQFVANELRALNSFQNRKKLKRMIQRAILDVCESEEY